MANNRMTEGVGKKIVEALKMQPDTDVDIDPTNETPQFTFEEEPSMEIPSQDDVMENVVEENNSDDVLNFDEDTQSIPESIEFEDEEPTFETQPEPVFDTSVNNAFELPNNFETPVNNFDSAMNEFNSPIMAQPAMQPISSVDDFEVPSNIAVLKQLISKLPAGVTKQTGALIIKQTMEALGISMKSVLHEAQQVQEGLNNSTRECQATIAEYKRQISALEKQAQKYQRQYSALNDIISLFVQTNF